MSSSISSREWVMSQAASEEATKANVDTLVSFVIEPCA